MVFGRLLEGMRVMRMIENVPAINGKPKLPVLISECPPHALLPPSLSLALTHSLTHTHMLTHAHAHTCTPTYTLVQLRARPLTPYPL